MASLFDTRTMLGIINEGNVNARTFFRDRYFANRRTFNTERIDFDVVGIGDRKLAPFVHPKSGGKVVDREGFRVDSYVAPEISLQRVTTAEDMLKRTAGEAYFGSKTPEVRAAEQLGKDLAELDEMITRREEVMCRDALVNGGIDITGVGYDETVSYWSATASEQPATTLTTKWDDSTVDAAGILGDLRSVRRGMIKKAGFVPTEIICGSDVIDVMIEKLAAAGALDNRRVDLGQINPQQLPNGVTYWGYLKDSALDIYSYDDWYIDDAGVEQPMMPAKKVLMASPNAKTTLAYGICSLIGADTVSFMEGARVPNSWVQKSAPAGRVVELKSRPLPIVNQVYGFHTITALA